MERNQGPFRSRKTFFGEVDYDNFWGNDKGVVRTPL